MKCCKCGNWYSIEEWDGCPYCNGAYLKTNQYTITWCNVMNDIVNTQAKINKKLNDNGDC